MSDAQTLGVIVGIGHTHFHDDYSRKDVVRTAEDLAKEALQSALQDSGLDAGDIDGLVIPYAPSGLIHSDILASQLGIAPRWINPLALYALDDAIKALATGQAERIAIIYASSQRSSQMQYGGAKSGSKMFPSYYYYNPWGFSSQGAHWALAFNRYQQISGATEADLGAVAVMQRANALLNPFAVMKKKPLTIDDYMATRYVCRPLRLLDYCMVNDGGIAVILTRGNVANRSGKAGVEIIGRAHTSVKGADQLRPLVMDLQAPIIGAAAAKSFAQAGLCTADVDHFQCYDSFSINLPLALEGVGFCRQGEGLRFIADGRANIGAELPSNTSGGMLSEAYMHTWNHIVEAVRQLRGEGDARQVPNAEISCFCFFTTESANVTLMKRA
jgi:acetyl-CoA acetyltransferase